MDCLESLKFGNEERVRLVEDTALKAAGGKTFAGSIPVLSVLNHYTYTNYGFLLRGILAEELGNSL